MELIDLGLLSEQNMDVYEDAKDYYNRFFSYI